MVGRTVRRGIVPSTLINGAGLDRMPLTAAGRRVVRCPIQAFWMCVPVPAAILLAGYQSPDRPGGGPPSMTEGEVT
ncbi:hypothetical protein DNK56_07355 [Streptomyces sp. AC1-42W]|nr:hypothetical protein DNK55_24090 [Streptomyces sp. AC1-42T]PZT81915.1 hypothetical protein DNK56_07355 [Streptomyces sp. AC1-42W]